jgi:hypothetical protein
MFFYSATERFSGVDTTSGGNRNPQYFRQAGIRGSAPRMPASGPRLQVAIVIA